MIQVAEEVFGRLELKIGVRFEGQFFRPDPVEAAAAGIDLALIILPVSNVFLTEISDDDAAVGRVVEVDGTEGDFVRSQREADVSRFEAAA